MNTSETRRHESNFYDLERIKQIPISDVCRNMLGIECQERGGNLWCKARPESAPSTILHEDKNTFYDFGTNEHGDVIQFTAYVLDINKKDAIKRLADAYHIAPINNRQGVETYELTDWEYSKIGIAGDLATKNFEFNVDRMPIERLFEISRTYAMPMNELRKKHPKTYEKLLLNRALPYIREMRTNYFLEVWSCYQLCSECNPSLFYDPKIQQSFTNQIKELETAERLFTRAAHGTSVKLKDKDPCRYDPVKVLEDLSHGNIKPTMSTAGYTEMQEAAKKQGCRIKSRPVDYNDYISSNLDQYFHSAFFKAGQVIVRYLETDYELLKPVFESMKKPEHSTSVDSRIQSAQSRQTNSNRSKAQHCNPER